MNTNKLGHVVLTAIALTLLSASSGAAPEGLSETSREAVPSARGITVRDLSRQGLADEVYERSGGYEHQ